MNHFKRLSLERKQAAIPELVALEKAARKEALSLPHKNWHLKQKYMEKAAEIRGWIKQLEKEISRP